MARPEQPRRGRGQEIGSKSRVIVGRKGGYYKDHEGTSHEHCRMFCRYRCLRGSSCPRKPSGLASPSFPAFFPSALLSELSGNAGNCGCIGFPSRRMTFTGKAGADCCPWQESCRRPRTARLARFLCGGRNRSLVIVRSTVSCPSFESWFHRRFSLAVRKAIVQPFSPSSSPAIKTPMKTAASPPVVEFSGGEEGRLGRFRGWTFCVSAGELLDSGAVSRGSPKVPKPLPRAQPAPLRCDLGQPFVRNPSKQALRTIDTTTDAVVP